MRAPEILTRSPKPPSRAPPIGNGAHVFRMHAPAIRTRRHQNGIVALESGTRENAFSVRSRTSGKSDYVFRMRRYVFWTDWHVSETGAHVSATGAHAS